MIEYIFDCIRATSGEEITIAAKLTNEDGSPITENCSLIFSGEKEIYRATGLYMNDMWMFSIPGAITEGLHGRYWYQVAHNNSSLNFKEPVYLK